MLEGTADIIVIGGGMVGAAAAYGLAGKGLDVLMLDEGDDAFRAARGNFGLVWVQTKGLGLPRYQEWSQESADRYAGLAAGLADSPDHVFDVIGAEFGNLREHLTDYERRHVVGTSLGK